VTRPSALPVPPKTVERLGRYRWILEELESKGAHRVFSHELAQRAGETSVLVRRDLMVIGSGGSPNRGYVVAELRSRIGGFLDGGGTHPIALVGVGKLGQALLDHFHGFRPSLQVVAAFDVAPDMVGRVVGGTPVLELSEVTEVVRAESIRTAILTVPTWEAQGLTNRLVSAGVLSLLNFTKARLRVPEGVYVEAIDLSVSLEKTAFFGHRLAHPEPDVATPTALERGGRGGH